MPGPGRRRLPRTVDQKGAVIELLTHCHIVRSATSSSRDPVVCNQLDDHQNDGRSADARTYVRSLLAVAAGDTTCANLGLVRT